MFHLSLLNRAYEERQRMQKITKSILTSVLITLFISPAKASIEQIQNLMQQGNFEQALTLTEQELGTNSDNIQALFLKGLILARMDKLNEAEKVFVDLTDNNPELPEPFNNLAVIYAARGDFDKAEAALRKAINTHPSYATAHENLGDIYAKMASQAYNRALKLDSGNKAAKDKLSMVSDLFSVPDPIVEEQRPVATRPETIAKVEEPVKPIVEEPKPEPAVVAEVKPEPVKPEAPESGTVVQPTFDKAAARVEVEAAINQWANAWSGKDVDGYINSYSQKFEPPRGLSRSAWKEQRRVRLNKPRFIKVTINNMKVEMLGQDFAMAKFKQSYQSDTYQDQVNKQLLMNKVNGVWLISKEESN